MNKTAIKNFAVWARQKLINDITYKAGMVGVTENGIAEKLPQSTSDLHFFDIGTKNYAEVSGNEILQREALITAIKRKEKELKSYKEAFMHVVEEVAYTWFNRLIAIRFMEVNDYLPSRIRVLSSENKAKNEPDFVTTPFDTDLEFSSYECDRVLELKDENKLDELFRTLFIKQCNKLHDILPELFETTDDYTELLLTISFTDKDGVVYRLVHDIDEDDFNVEKEGQVEIIGWMYQYYNIEPKAAVFARASGTKMKKEDIPAATQLFTPDWIVRYMVENSLGRIWIEGHHNDSLKSTWKYYLDEAEQEPEVVEKLNKIKATYRESSPESIKVIDPCMGSGHILVYAFDVLMQIYESCGYTQRDAASSILENNLYGLDIDKRAYQLAYFAVMMKARQYNRRILRESIEPNLCYLINSRNLHETALEKMGDCRQLTERVISENLFAEEYGSVLSISLSVSELKKIENQLKKLNSNTENVNIIDIADLDELNTYLYPVIKQSKLLAQKYEVAVTNPPYLSGSAVGQKLNEYIKSNYPDSKTDLFAVFIERCKKMLVSNGLQAMITMHSWMFISSYERLREKIILNDLVNMVHLGARAFDEIAGEVVQTTAFVTRNTLIGSYKGIYCRLIEPNSENAKKEAFLSKEKRYSFNQSDYSKIPGKPISYWVSENMLKAYENGKTLGTIAFPKTGMTTGDNNRFLRFWFEMNIHKANFNAASAMEAQNSNSKWFPYCKGGGYRRWYGYNEYLVNWFDNGYEIKNNVKDNGLKAASVRSEGMYFKPLITWSAVTSGIFSCRYCAGGALFDSGGSSISVPENTNYLLALLNSKVGQYILDISNATINYQPGDIAGIPVLFDSVDEVEVKTEKNIDISKNDWDAFETSWDFRKHPLVPTPREWQEQLNSRFAGTRAEAFSKLSWHYKQWEYYSNYRFESLKENEEELNRIFIRIYGLENELTPDIPEKDVSVRKADLQRDIKSLLSYAVGCMFGRYSIDKEGLVFAGGDFREVYIDDGLYPSENLFPSDNLFPKDPEYTKIKTDEGVIDLSFYPDFDNCIPITDEEYFKDDIVGLFCAWLKKVYGEKTLEENLEFIANALDTKGATSREKIRNYFLNGFIKDHIKTYQKRPIYWMFDSGKQNGFKALCYMHRWNADTIGNMRVEYLHRIQRVYEKEIDRMQEIIDNSSDRKEVAASTKRKEKLQKQLKETAEYDTKVAHLALSRIDIDLDDGVKVNYEKVQTAPDGKKLQILTKI